MPDVSTLHIATGAAGHGAKHGAKAGSALPVSTDGFFQVLAGRLGLKAASGAEGAEATALAGSDGLPGLSSDMQLGVLANPGAGDKASDKVKGGLLDAALSGDSAAVAAGNAAIPAQFSGHADADADADASVPAQAPAIETVPQAGDATAAPAAAGASAGNAAILARFSARTDAHVDTGAHTGTDANADTDTDASVPVLAPALAVAPQAQAGAAMTALAAAGASSAQSSDGKAPPGGKLIEKSLGAAVTSGDGEKEALAASLAPVQGKRSGRASGAISAAPGQLLPSASVEKGPGSAPLDRGAAGQGKELRIDVALPQFGQSGKGEAALASLPPAAGAVQPDTTMARPFDHLLRTAEVKLNIAVDAPVRSAGFPAELGEKVVWLAGRQSSGAELSLNPSHLGPVEVRLSMNGGEVGAQFFSPNLGVREAIEAALPKLRELMAEAGINLGQASVRDEGFQRREGAEAKAQGGMNPGGEPFDQVWQVDGVSVMSTRSGLGMVDLYI